MVIRLVDEFSKDISSQVMARQVLRSATSVGANIVEAQASLTRKDFALFLTHSLKSSNETLYWLMLLKDAGKVSEEKIDSVIAECEELGKILGTSIVTIKSGIN